MSVGRTVSVVVPTMGASPWLAESLDALRREDPEAEILLVDQSPGGVGPNPAVDRVLRQPPGAGFAAANVAAFQEAGGDFVATVNDDAVVEPGWLAALVAALEDDPGAAAVQGANLRPRSAAGDALDGDVLDGAGIAWNRWWQAVQIGHGRPPATGAGDAPREVFGVAATAALYRRAALDRLDGPAFDPALVSYYEDVELAVRLRAAGHRALVVPRARARHAGSTSGARLPRRGLDLIYGNRWLVLARLLGGELRRAAPRAVERDLRDLGRALLYRQLATVRGILGGWRHYRRLRHRFVHAGPPLVAASELRRLAAPPPP